MFSVNEQTHCQFVMVDSGPLDPLGENWWTRSLGNRHPGCHGLNSDAGCGGGESECEEKRNQTDWNLERSTGRTAVCLGQSQEPRPEAQDESEWHGHHRCRVSQRPCQNQVYIRLSKQPRRRVVPRPRTRLAEMNPRNWSKAGRSEKSKSQARPGQIGGRT